jgi:hypothetical protein
MVKRKVNKEDEDRAGYQEMGAMDEALVGMGEETALGQGPAHADTSHRRNLFSWLDNVLEAVDHGGVIRDYCEFSLLPPTCVNQHFETCFLCISRYKGIDASHQMRSKMSLSYDKEALANFYLIHCSNFHVCKKQKLCASTFQKEEVFFLESQKDSMAIHESFFERANADSFLSP